METIYGSKEWEYECFLKTRKNIIVFLSEWGLMEDAKEIYSEAVEYCLENGLNFNDYIKESIDELIKKYYVVYKPKKYIAGYIYFVRFMDKIKIGRTKNLKNRVYQLKLSNPEIELIGSFEYYDTVGEEKRLHTFYGDKRIKMTEWFYLTDEEVMKEINSLKF